MTAPASPLTPEQRAELARQKAIDANAHREHAEFLAARRSGDVPRMLAARKRFMAAMVGCRQHVIADINPERGAGE